MDRRQVPAPAPLRGLRLAFVTDIHVSRVSPHAADPLFPLLAELQADCVLWGGDYAESAEHQRAFFRMLAGLRPPLGMFGVLGNNDKECFGSAFPVLRRLAADAGMRLLVNEQAAVRAPAGGRLLIGGLDECKYGCPSAKGFFRSAGSEDLRVLLTHYPHGADNAFRTAAMPPQLILSGHTHGGQIRVFGRTAYDLGYGRWYARKAKRFWVSGWRETDGAQMLVSNGIGESLLPIRIGAPRQVHCIDLV